MSPNTIACVGHACWQAVWRAVMSSSGFGLGSPANHPFSASPLSFLRFLRVLLIRWMQYVHFSIPPRVRTVTSGLWRSWATGVFQSAYWKKLNRRTLYGQLFEQYRVPMHRLYVISLMPSALWLVATTGHTTSHGAFSQCWHSIGWKY